MDLAIGFAEAVEENGRFRHEKGANGVVWFVQQRPEKLVLLIATLDYGIDVTSSKSKARHLKLRQNPVLPFVKILSFTCLLALSVSNAFADAAAELAGFSVFDKVDLAALANSPSVAHGTPMSGSYISAQSCFVVAAPPARVADALRQWNPARHSELKVLLHSDLASPGPASFPALGRP